MINHHVSVKVILQNDINQKLNESTTDKIAHATTAKNVFILSSFVQDTLVVKLDKWSVGPCNRNCFNKQNEKYE